MTPFSAHTAEICRIVSLRELKSLALPAGDFSNRFNSQHCILKMIVGPLSDSATNNILRLVHLHYQPFSLQFTDYANNGNKDRCIAFQDYQHEPWHDLVPLFKATNLHFAHLAERVDETKLGNVQLNGLGEIVTLEGMIRDYGRHLGEIE